MGADSGPMQSETVALSRGAVLLARAMRIRGHNQTAVGVAVGVGRNVVCRWLSGQRRAALEYAVRIERAYGVPVSSWSQTCRRRRSRRTTRQES